MTRSITISLLFSLFLLNIVSIQAWKTNNVFFHVYVSPNLWPFCEIDKNFARFGKQASDLPIS